MIDDQTFLVLNTVYLKKMATAPQIATLTGAEPAAIGEILAAAAGQGWLLDMDGQCLLLPDGVQAVRDYYDAAYRDQRVDPATDGWYRRFETINAQFIQQVSEWQAGGDQRAQGRLMRCVERLVRSIGDLVPAVPRYASYVRRFERGLALIDQGQLDYIANPTLDSVHNVWFEFHEDILTVLGRPRDA